MGSSKCIELSFASFSFINSYKNIEKIAKDVCEVFILLNIIIFYGD
jgi:hypothetical protein